MVAAIDRSPAFEIEDFLAQEQAKDLLRFTTAGSVDDGKSTLIGRLLYDSQSIYEDQLKAVTKASVNRSAGPIDFSLLTDGLRAEREQGITIDVAYRYFATARRKFIIADTPGHEQYTRNMATGASTADLAIILIDARNGVLAQSRRHAYIASLLGIPNFAIAVNKMDLVGYDADVFRGIETEFREFLAHLNATHIYFLPISALAGDNVVRRSRNMPWFGGPSLLEYLETVPVYNRTRSAAFRFPVQRVMRPDQTFRGYAGQVASGTIRPGDAILALPSGQRSRVKSIETFDGPLDEAVAPMSVTLTLEDELDISRGDMICFRRSNSRGGAPVRCERGVAQRAAAGSGAHLCAETHHADHASRDKGGTAPRERDIARARAGRAAGDECDRRIANRNQPANLLRCLRREPDHRQLYPDRSGQQRHRGRGDDHWRPWRPRARVRQSSRRVMVA